jgi:hypothetical protein
MPMSALSRCFRFAAALLLTVNVALAAFPRITGYSPVRGAPGTLVTLTGQNFGGLIEVRFGTTKATVQGANASFIQVIVPTEAQSGPIHVTTVGGDDSTLALSLPHFQVAPRIQDFYRDFGGNGQPNIPAKANVGERIYIRGANLDDPNRPNDPDFGLGVFVNGVRATSGSVTSPTTIQIIVPAGASTGPITITNFAGVVTSSQLLYFQPVIAFFTARAAIGETMEIRGSNFTGITEVKFGQIPATSFTVLSATNLQAVVPPNAVTGKLTITAPGGAYISLSDFRVLPNITGFSPAGGSPGTVVTVDGTALTGTTAVRFAGVAAERFTNISATRITAVVPTAAVSGPISVVTANGTNSSAANFFLAPVITTLSPGQGLPGSTVRITGRSFTGVTSARLGTNEIGGFTVDSGTQITLTVPANAKSARFSVTGPGGSAESPIQFRVLGTEPTITEFLPPFGLVGAQVTLRGDNLAAVTNVAFNGLKATFSVANGTNLLAIVPPGASSGPIQIGSPDGSFVTSRSFFVGNRTDLRTTFSVNQNPAVAYGPLTGTWRIANLGAVPATNLVGRLTLPAGVQYFDVSASHPFTFAGSEVRVTADSLNPDATVLLTLRVMVGPPAAITFGTTVTNGVTDANLTNNATVLPLTATPPRLFLEPLPGAGLLLSWSAAGTNYVAEQQAELGSPTWNPLAGNPDNDGATLQLTVPATLERGFYRVRALEVP